MKITLTISRLIGTTGGAQKSVVELANELNSRGHSVSIISFETSSKQQSVLLYELNKNVDLLTVIRPPKGELGMVVSSQTLHPRLREEILWYDKQRSVLEQLALRLIDIKPEIVVAFLPSTFTVVAKALDGTGLPIVIANRSDPAIDYTLKRFMPNAYDVKIRKVASIPAAANLVLIDEFVSYFSDEVRKKTYVIPSTVDNANSPEFGDWGQGREKIVMTAGRLDAIKNQEVLIRSFAKIAHKHPQWKLNIFGDGELMEKYSALIDKTNMKERIFLKGTTRQISRELSRSSIFVLPSITEGFSRALTEAMANGLPSIVLEQCRSNRFLVKESRGGVLSENKVDSMAKQLDHLIKNPGQRVTMGENAQKYVKRFKRKDIYDQWESVLLKVLADHKPEVDWQARLQARLRHINSHMSSLLIKQVEYQQQSIVEQKKQIKKQDQQLAAIYNTRAYKVGKTMLAIARKARSLRNSN